MRSSCGRAVVAASMPGEADALAAMLREAGFSGTVCVRDGQAAIYEVQSAPTDVLIADAVLPVLDGAALARRIGVMGLTVFPAVILLAVPGMCPRAGDCVLEKPVSRDRLLAALGETAVERRKIPEDRRMRALQTIDALGVPEHCGRDYLLRAIELVWLDARLGRALTTKLYPTVGSAFGVDARRVERAMRHVIDAAWRSGALEVQYRIFGDTIDARRGSPTCGEMIAQIADILRWEGKA